MKAMKNMKLTCCLVAAMLLSSCGNIVQGPNQDQIDYEILTQFLTDRNIDAERHSSGLNFVMTNRGQGISPVPGDTALINYTFYLLDGTLLDTTDEELARNNGTYSPNDNYSPFEFVLGEGRVIQGVEIGTQLLTEGGSAIFYLPSRLAWGGGIYPGSVYDNNLILEMELVEVKH